MSQKSVNVDIEGRFTLVDAVVQGKKKSFRKFTHSCTPNNTIQQSLFFSELKTLRRTTARINQNSKNTLL